MKLKCSLSKMNSISKHIHSNRIPYLLLGILAFIFSFPFSFGAEPLLITNFSPLFITLYLIPILFEIHHHPKYIFLKCWAYTFLGAMGALYWIVISMKGYGGLSMPLSLAGLIGTCLFRTLFAALALWLWKKFSTTQNLIILGAALMTSQDWILHLIPFGGFPWMTAGYALTPDLFWIQTADIWGVHGLGLGIYFISFSLFHILCLTKPISLKSFSSIFILLVSVHIYGISHIYFSSVETKGKDIKVGWIQGNINQALKWKSSEKKTIVKKYHQATLKLQEQNLDLIVWPEASVPITYSQNRKNIFETNIEGNQIPILFGAPSYERTDKTKRYYNSAFITDPTGDVLFRYDKIHLVPFGEFVPTLGFNLSKHIPVLAGSFYSGKTLKPAKIKEYPFGISICYEVLYPRMFRKLFNQGSTFFVNLTNDAWFDRSSGPYQHARFAILRAIESRKTLLRVANTGFSSIYLPSGRITRQSNLFEDHIDFAHLKTNTIKPIYMRVPYLSEVLILVLLLCSILQYCKRKHDA